MSRFLTYTAVYGILERDGKVFMLRRANTGYQDGSYCLPAGHVEEGETPLTAMRRELLEETGVEVAEADLQFVHVLYRMQPQRTYHDYFFRCVNWEGEPCNAETSHCDDARWVDVSTENVEMVPGMREALRSIKTAQPFSVIKFEER